MEKVLYKGQKKALKLLLHKLRLNYNLYDEDDKEVIDAIHVIEEELDWNVKETDEAECML